MNVYKQKNKPNYYFAIVTNNETGRGQKVINTYAGDKRIATEVMRKTQLLAESVEAGMPLTAELRKWLGQMNPKLRKRLAAIGLLAVSDNASVGSIQQHVEDYLSACTFRGDAGSFVKIKRSQLLRVVQGTQAHRLADLTLERVSQFLQKLQQGYEGQQALGARSINQNRATVVSFLNWCVDHNRLESHRVSRVPRLNEELERSIVRRCATEAELDRFLSSVPDKRWLKYLMALLTGLRRNELRQLEARDIDLGVGTLTVRAEVAKTKKGMVLPLHDELRDPLEIHLMNHKPQDQVFDSIPRIETYRRDLKKAGVEYVDAQGLQLDFHALRSTFTTRLLREGVPPSIARRLTRHKSVKTLERYYDKLGFDDAEGAMRKMPGVDSKRPDREASKRSTASERK